MWQQHVVLLRNAAANVRRLRPCWRRLAHAAGQASSGPRLQFGYTAASCAVVGGITVVDWRGHVAHADETASASGSLRGSSESPPENFQTLEKDAGEDASATGGSRVVAFNLSSDEDNPYRCFSNFYKELDPYIYEIKFGSKTGCRVMVEHAMKALHITKASIFKDDEGFDDILAEPMAHKCKAKGRKCKNFDDAVWQSMVHEVAYEVVLQKFSSSEELTTTLLSTGDKIIAEANLDTLWGIGLEEDDPRVQSPEEWPGQNVLGKALMRARETILQQQSSGAL
eukprot:CAMPEP_0178394048 /NCGR_PEP_ID=MMETSP0689_2-20121128/12501_1 /TAXON_ID=160604 /ORGANISM="Amphidinium massartii, Strain CS-259" /LENGTH=282 /DNA_ID=CAMNT_0020014657 /DNA_START=1 /DNA_END=849 /DNA_ORIENTATION=-